MFLPSNISESGAISTINQIANLIAPQFVFGYNTIEDNRQQAWIFSLEALPKYQPFDENGNERPLANFIYVHVFRRFLNMYRDKCHKPCPIEISSGVMPEDEDRYLRWKEKNTSLKNILVPTSLAEGIHSYEDDVHNELENKETERIIDENLNINLRSYYLKMKSGVTIPYSKRMAVIKEIKTILNVEGVL